MAINCSYLHIVYIERQFYIMDLREITNNKNRHPWELSRANKLMRLCRNYLPNRETIKIGDIGAGDRYFDNQLILKLKNENITPIIYAIDNEYENTISNQEEIVMFSDISMLENNSMDCIIMMDVLEHIEDDNSFLKLALDKLKWNGFLIITVPAFESLFSSHDTYLKHFRRYNYMGLRELLLTKNLHIVRSYYFYTSLYVARWLQLKLKKNKADGNNVGIGMWKYNEESFITRVLKSILNIDFSVNVILNKFGIRLPGLSLLAVAIKNNSSIEQEFE